MSTCLFCEIALGRTPAHIVYQDQDVVAFRDINPQAPVHVLIIPRKHIAHVGEADENDEVLLGRVARIAARVAADEGVAETGFRCVMNFGRDAMQSVPHLHMHVIGGRALSWPPG